MKRSLLLLAVWITSARAFAADPQYWFCTPDIVTAKATDDRPSGLAFMDFFQPDAPWSQSVGKLNVFKFSTQFFLGATDDQVKTAVADLRRRHVAIGVEMGVVLQEPTCGGGEGFMQEAQLEKFCKKLTGLGVTIDYLAMDEPVWMSHEASWRHPKGPACNYPVEKVAERVGLSIAKLRTYFPNLKVGDIEVVGDPSDRKLDYHKVIADYVEFAKLFEKTTGTKLAFFHSDISWQTNWRPVVPLLAAAMHDQGIRFGVIFGGVPTDPTDEAFVKTGMTELKEFAQHASIRPDDVIVQTWQPRPSKLLPENDPGTETHLLLEAESIMSEPQ